MTEKELDVIDARFASTLAGVDVLLFWTGVDQAHAQKWATVWKMKTLTVAMGPLMDSKNPSSPKALKGRLSYSRYVKGASGRFAQYARQYCRVVVLTNPPPCIYSSRENNTYQTLEEPILKGRFGGSPVRRIDYLHPTVDDAAHVTYQVWPCDKTRDWAVSFGKKSINSWKRLNWSYQSLITTSQLQLEPQYPQTNYRSLAIHSMPSQASRPNGILSVHESLLGSSVNVTNVERDVANGDNIMELPESVDLVLAGGLGINDHESQDPDPRLRPGVSIGSDNDLTVVQVHDQVGQGIDFHESGPLYEPSHVQTPAYAIERCRLPASPVAVPIVSIDDLTFGFEKTIDINENGLNKDFLYLTMKVGLELRCWKLRWTDRK